jgi:hypothetical protein
VTSYSPGKGDEEVEVEASVKTVEYEAKKMTMQTERKEYPSFSANIISVGIKMKYGY